MQVFKFFILIIIFLSSSLIGVLISKKYSNRVKQLMEINNILNMLETKIKFTYEPLPEIFNEFSKDLSSNIADVFKDIHLKMKTQPLKISWEFAIDGCNLDINDEDKNILKKLGNMLRPNRCKWTSFTN